MGMLVVRIWEMRVLVLQPEMSMPVRMRRRSVMGFRVGVLMVFVMHMRMRVFLLLVDMFVFMAFGEVQPDAQRHQAGRGPERRWCRLAEQNQGNGGADERRRREIRPGTRGA